MRSTGWDRGARGTHVGPWVDAKRLFRKVAGHPLASFLLPFCLVLIGRVLFLPLIPPPQPMVHDEFSYLLAGDTFASFRLTNPPHAYWQHFETIHELAQPTYMSKYQPAQGMVLAFGQLIFGTPWAGVLFSMALLCGLLPWAFRPAVPATWALTGALLATFKIGIVSYWTDTYWGGACAAIGGTLALGAMLRLARAPSAAMAAVFTLGVGILANSRPEGAFIITVGYGGYLLWKWFGGDRWRKNWISYPVRLLPGACLVALPLLLFMAYYNYRITGSALTLPYQIYERQYSIWTAFVWQQKPSPEPIYHHEFLRQVWVDWDGAHKTFERQHWLYWHWSDLRLNARFYFGSAFYPGFLLLIATAFIGGKSRAIFGLLLFYCATTIVALEVFPHYVAPAAALFYLGAIVTLRTSWHLGARGFPWGKGAVLILVAYFLVSTALTWTRLENRTLFYPLEYAEKRGAVLAVLNLQPGRQLVFVRHGVVRTSPDIWIFNRADIDASPIVWVDSMSPGEDQQILDYYAPQKRTAWMLDDEAEVTLRPFGQPEAAPLYERKNPTF